ncbi:ATP/GTP-binding protein (plasmid) [Streptomyces canus]|uniref:ATP/GTP-binding protein n=1 Tax=Streptomyces canus TaxID=58343 RepID=UPI003868B6E5|nr:ATP/GTP-binding protein [Streptomyces canus]
MGAVQATAYGDGGKVVCDNKGWCRVVADDTQTTPGSAGDDGKQASDGGSSPKPKCYDSNMANDTSVPCHLDGIGDWVNGMNCYFQVANPQPPAGDPRWEGRDPKDGAVYDAYCPDNPNKTSQWFAQAPNGAAPAVDPRVLALEAIKKMQLLGPNIGIAPNPNGKGVVGMPVWMWAKDTPNAWGPVTASASAGAVTVTATANVSKVIWSMGDGTTVTCAGRGTPYTASYGMRASPDCGHRYSQPSSSQQSGKYHVTATATWTIDWQGGGQNGQINQTLNNAVDITVAEVQVLN